MRNSDFQKFILQVNQGDNRLYKMIPERKLWARVLIVAMREFEKGIMIFKGREHYRDILEYKKQAKKLLDDFFFNPDYQWVIGGFSWICDQIFIDPEPAILTIRKKLKEIENSRVLTDPLYCVLNDDELLSLQKRSPGPRMVQRKQSGSVKISKYH